MVSPGKQASASGCPALAPALLSCSRSPIKIPLTTAEAVALEILDIEVRGLARTRATTETGLKLKASYASTETASLKESNTGVAIIGKQLLPAWHQRLPIRHHANRCVGDDNCTIN